VVVGDGLPAELELLEELLEELDEVIVNEGPAGSMIIPFANPSRSRIHPSVST